MNNYICRQLGMSRIPKDYENLKFSYMFHRFSYSSLAVLVLLVVLVVVLVVLATVCLVPVAAVACHYFYYH